MLIDHSLKTYLLSLCNADEIIDISLIQGVWGGYGELFRVTFTGGKVNSVVVKQVNTPRPQSHPRGWNTSLAHQRKLFSYQVESNWYSHYADSNNENCYSPRCLDAQNSKQKILLVLEDLAEAGYPLVKTEVTLDQAKTCISWLAGFHAQHLQESVDGLWPTGTYWHLATRPDELDALQDQELKNAAGKIDKILSQCEFQTIVHGDAKLANFCFSEDGKKAAAVDFQYAGKGCGMKDLILFISSCITPDKCFQLESLLVDYYFKALTEALEKTQPQINAGQVELAWRPLYGLAWADFQRFIKGWSPGHWKINDYTEQLTRKVLNSLDQFE